MGMERLLKSCKPKLSAADKAAEAEQKKAAAEEEEKQAAAQAAESARTAGANAVAQPTMSSTADQDKPLKPGDPVEVHGLQSETGRMLNGKTGLITKFVEDKGRFQIELGLPTLQS